MTHRIHNPVATPVEHVAALVRHIRCLEFSVERVWAEGDPKDPSGLRLESETGEVLASGEDVVTFLDQLPSEAEALEGPSDAPVIEICRVLVKDVRTAGMACDRATYEAAYGRAFEHLDALAATVREQRYISGGNTPSLGDLWLFAVLVRFDVVYYSLYKCNRYRVQDHPVLGAYLRDLYQRPGFADSVDWSAIKRAYFLEEERINPKMRIPLGVPDLWAPSGRAEVFARQELTEKGTEDTAKTGGGKGEWVRKHSGHRGIIAADPKAEYPAEPGRYHLYIANNCPWCHRVALARMVKGLEDVISCDVLYYRRDGDRGWQFKPDEPGCTPDRLFDHTHIKQLYERVGSPETSVPVLYDRVTQSIVNNESSEIIRMLDQAFSAHATRKVELFPAALADEIERYNAWIYTDINNGAYKAGFSSSQGAYELAYARFFSALDRLDRILESRKFLCGDAITEADIRLFPTIFRFDHVYLTRFNLDQKRVRDCPHLHRWLRDMLDIPGVREASNLRHCKEGYFGRSANNIVPLGPDYGFEA